jgi:ABC-type spermidine/putrescine transport system permease subunit II
MSPEKRNFVKLTYRYAFSLFIILNIPYLLALGSALHSYKGICYGFTDGSSPCKFGTYVGNELFFASALSLIPVVICVALWGGAVGLYCKLKLRKRRVRHRILNLLPFGGGILGLVIGFHT